MPQTSYKASIIFLTATIILVLFGFAIMASSSIPLSQKNFGESYYYLRHQLILGLGVGMIAFFIALKIKFSLLRSLALPIFIIVLMLLLLVFVPSLGLKSGGAKRWINLGFFSFQPSEFAKLAVIIYLAKWLESKKDRIQKPLLAVFVVFILMLVGACIIFEPDFGTAILIFSIGSIMFFSAGSKIKTMIGIGMIALILFINLAAIEPYRLERVFSFLDASQDMSGKSYQQNQALIAIGSGKLLGLGLGKGVQKYQYLPETIGDSVFAIIAEEIGLAGSVIILFLYLSIVLSGFKIALNSSNFFGRTTAIGITSWLGLQTFINLLGILKLIPFTGIPLPFISYGGTALIVELAAAGLMLNIAKQKSVLN